MIAKLVMWLGMWGVRALLAWIVALFLLIVGSFMQSRPRIYLLALLLVVIANLCSYHNFNVWYAAIRLDRRDEINEALAGREPQEGLATTVRFAEDDPEDRVEGGAMRQPTAEPVWREGGKKVRGGGDAAETTAAPGADDESLHTSAEEDVIYMKQEQISLVRQLSRGNSLVMRAVTLLILLALLYDYIVMFNAARSTRWPLPISCSLLDGLSVKTRAMVIRNDVNRRWLPPDFLARAVRKGENVIYFGEQHLWPDRPWLPRLTIFNLPLWRLPVFRYGSATTAGGSETAFDAAWFGRYAVTIDATTDALAMMEDFLDIIRERRSSGARARRTLIIAWDRNQPIEKEFMVTFAKLAEETNFSLFVWTRSSSAKSGV